MVGVIVMAVCVLMACRWDFFEEVMYPVRRGVDQKKQKRRRVKG